MDPNYNNNNQTDFSNTQYNQNNDNYTDNSYISSNPINPGNKNFFERTKKSMEKMDEINEATDYLKDIIEYDVLCEEERNGKKLYDMSVVDELIDVMVSAMTSSKPYINIGGEDIPIQRIKSRFEKYNMNIFQYAYDSLKDNTTKVKNIRKYMLAVLFNAPMTINSFYRAEVNHDFYGG